MFSLAPRRIAKIICNLFIPSFLQSDNLIWGLTADGVYSVKTGALLAQGLVPFAPNTVDFCWNWKLQIAPKIKFFLWKSVK